MTTFLRPGDRVLLTGDSITDWGRDRDQPDSPWGLGHGYAGIVAALAGARRPDLDLTFHNRGIGGDTTRMLRERWQPDALDLEPTVVSILVGVNDTWRRFDSGAVTSVEEYEGHYRAILQATRERLDPRFVLVEPFVLPVPPVQPAWREDLNPRIHVVRRLAAEYDAALVPADGLFAAAAARTPPERWAFDGVHPTAAGHGLLAEAWLAAVGLSA
ncbi:SGNH/GDSL hydrolase family protein [Cellulomonas wangsupingiae]|uniref:SGNH/GDSL hydrolase family protein n=1 Tax=Cellulomonas wangsupingiae TaxID=2968085 RepID=A0ABY5K9L0_9CELL|nr:SGNH/GDSL hydrolase family protein [Cellulomonas wangsupingiae]MCC2334581.1 SGNH/GDSL hydrolase family protein [Cellulomonas wangsupingiae]UUI66453.1 SGNH/GDSL hydrolase family protein [Cellulomonas wangsupingiae]